MAHKSHFTAKTHTAKGKSTSNKAQTTFGRVVKVIYSLEDSDCKDSSMLNGIYFRLPKNPADETIPNKLQFARQGDASIRVLPMPGEMVEIHQAPGRNSTEGSIYYWIKVVNIWNTPHHNANPDIKQLDWEDALLGGSKESATINPLQANPGDTLIEGRLGQSIRFTGNQGDSSLETDSENNGMPVILISNGQIKTTEGTTPISEDINEDASSLYFLSNHKTTLTSANNKRDSYNAKPLESSQYVGNQVILNGGRLFFNAKQESIFLSAVDSVGINAKTLNFDATDYYCVDANKIYLGKKARTSQGSEPVILGTQLQNWLETLLDTLENVGNAMSSATAVGAGPVTQLLVVGPELIAVSKALKAQMNLFQSKKVFTE